MGGLMSSTRFRHGICASPPLHHRHRHSYPSIHQSPVSDSITSHHIYAHPISPASRSTLLGQTFPTGSYPRLICLFFSSYDPPPSPTCYDDSLPFYHATILLRRLYDLYIRSCRHVYEGNPSTSRLVGWFFLLLFT